MLREQCRIGVHEASNPGAISHGVVEDEVMHAGTVLVAPEVADAPDEVARTLQRVLKVRDRDALECFRRREEDVPPHHAIDDTDLVPVERAEVGSVLGTLPAAWPALAFGGPAHFEQQSIQLFRRLSALENLTLDRDQSRAGKTLRFISETGRILGIESSQRGSQRPDALRRCSGDQPTRFAPCELDERRIEGERAIGGLVGTVSHLDKQRNRDRPAICTAEASGGSGERLFGPNTVGKCVLKRPSVLEPASGLGPISNEPSHSRPAHRNEAGQ